MIRALMKPVSTVALLAAASLAMGFTSASAADLGGDCCADLEERVAELEATTARKGNRKVSLEVSGHVNQALMFWDDGDETNLYVVTNDTNRSRFRFKGNAKIDSDWEAGYLLEIGVRTARSDRVDQGGTDSTGGANLGDDGETEFDIRHSYWYAKSKTYGQISLGHTDMATEGITETNLANTGDVAKNADVEDYFAGFQLRAKGVAGNIGLSALEWRRLIKDDAIQPGEGNRRETIKYTTPTFQGFAASVAFAEDDSWDAALRYHGEFSGFKIAAGIGYGENTDGTDPRSGSTEAGNATCIVNDADIPDGDASCNQVGGSISILHEASGVFLTFGAGQFTDDNINATGTVFEGVANADDESTFYSFMGGIEQKWNALGKTTLYGEYFKHEGGANDRTVEGADAINPFAGTARIWNSEVQVIGGGIVQAIDAAAMNIYIGYRHIEGDVTLREDATGNLSDVGIEDLDVVMTGAAIKF